MQQATQLSKGRTCTKAVSILFVVLQVVPVTIDEYSLQGYYSCPVYTNMQRANVYSPIVSNFTMKTDEPSHKWVLASVAVLLQDELA